MVSSISQDFRQAVPNAMNQPTESPPLTQPTPLKDVLNVVSTSIENAGSAASTKPSNPPSSTKSSTPPISSPPPSPPPISSSSPRSSSSVRSVHNHTSAWEPYIFHYTVGIPTPTLFLFVVNFHEPRYAPVRFLSTQYFPLFRRHFLFDFDVVFLGPWENRGDRVLSHHLPIHGHFSYRSLAIAYEQLCVREACRYASFVLMNDDSYLDPLFLLSYPLEKSLTEPSRVLRPRGNWMWLRKRNTRNQTYAEAFDAALRELVAQPRWNKCQWGKPENRRRGFADFFMIHRSNMSDFCEASAVMYRHRVFLEMAAPTINYCFTRTFVDDCNHGPMKNRRTCVHMHPVKYRQPGNEQLAINRLLRHNMDAAPPRMW